jgi:hypothetical protein
MTRKLPTALALSALLLLVAAPALAQIDRATLSGIVRDAASFGTISSLASDPRRMPGGARFTF